ERLTLGAAAAVVVFAEFPNPNSLAQAVAEKIGGIVILMPAFISRHPEHVGRAGGDRVGDAGKARAEMRLEGAGRQVLMKGDLEAEQARDRIGLGAAPRHPGAVAMALPREQQRAIGDAGGEEADAYGSAAGNRAADRRGGADDLVIRVRRQQ